jgi:hypothetical protein
VEQLPQVQEAVRAVPGVASARIRWPAPDAPAILQVTFEDGADRAVAAAAVLRAMEASGVDGLTLRIAGPGDAQPATDVPGVGGEAEGGPVTPSATAAAGTAAPTGRAGRPVFSGLIVERTALDMTVSVTLRTAGQATTASAQGLASNRQTPRTAAAAAVRALHGLLPEDVRVSLDWLDVVRAPDGGSGIVHAAVTWLGPDGEERLVGSALERGDAGEAAVRATLDALNRRLERAMVSMA